MPFQRSQVQVLQHRLQEVPRFITIIAGPRQVGKTTLVRQAMSEIKHWFVSIDPSGESSQMPFGLPDAHVQEAEGVPRNAAWLVRTWQAARAQCAAYKRDYPDQSFVFVLDEIQKITRWPETVKGLWDADRANNLPMHVVLLGSSPLLSREASIASIRSLFDPRRCIWHWASA
jgi:uncharacterized protein